MKPVSPANGGVEKVGESIWRCCVFCWGWAGSQPVLPEQANIFVGLIYLPWLLYFFLNLASLLKIRGAIFGRASPGLTLALVAPRGPSAAVFIHNSLMLGLFAVFLLFEKRAPGFELDH